MDTKRCTICCQTKPLAEFPRLSPKKNYRLSRCYPCHLKYMQKRYKSRKVEYGYLLRALDDDKLMLLRENYGKLTLRKLSEILDVRYDKIRAWNCRKKENIKQFAGR